jgi:hypothetical protein
MPVLAAYIGFSSISYLVYKSSNDYVFGTYPYTYSADLFDSYSSESQFYIELFSNILRDNNLKFLETDILVGDYIRYPDLEFEVKRSYLLSEILKGISLSHFPLNISSYSITTPNSMLCYLPVSNGEYLGSDTKKMETDELNYYFNYSIYPNIVNYEMTLLIDHDRNIVSKLRNTELEYNNKLPLCFMGSRFSYPYGQFNKESDYILLLNILKNPGIYELELDRDRYLMLAYMLNSFDKSLELRAEGKIEKVGTLINTFGDVECMITSEIGTSQLLDIEKDRVFVLPLNYNEKAHVIIKNNTIGTMEKDVIGGKLGVIFDTRLEKYDITENLKVFNDSIKILEQALNKI